MFNKRTLICIGIITALIIPSNLQATTCCDQTYTIYGKTQGDYSILIWDLNIGGECYIGYTRAFLFTPDTLRLFSKKFEYAAGGWAEDFINNNSYEKIDTLIGKDGIYKIKEGISVAPPIEDTSFVDKWRMITHSGCCGADLWYKNCPVNCIDLPVFDGCEAKLLYYYNGGLYKNYSLKEVYYFPESRLVIILSHQPEYAAGMDRMDGIMMFKIEENDKGE